MKKLRYSKTFWVNMMVVAASVLVSVTNTEVIASNPQIVAYLGAALGMVNVVLRLLTTEGVKGV